MRLLRALEMGFELDEFLRLLPLAVAPCDFQVNGMVIQVTHPYGQVLIRLQPMPIRRIGALSLPVTQVEIHSTIPESQLTPFLDRFNLSYQKGGG